MTDFTTRSTVRPSIEEMIALTPLWDGDRSDDGRPRVPDAHLRALRTATCEQVWEVLWFTDPPYPHQFDRGWKQTNPGHPLVGRAVTCSFLPFRADYDASVVAAGNDIGFTVGERQNTWVVESLAEGDCMVADIFGKITEGTVVGDNLGTAVAARTGVGAVIDGGVRDLAGLQELTEANIFFRGAHPTPIRDVTLAGMNVPVMIGPATVLPGDVVHGTESGVTFIPPHLVAECVDVARRTAHRDIFGKARLASRTYTSTEIDTKVWADHIEADYADWTTQNPMPEL